MTNEEYILCILPYIPCPIMVETRIRKLVGATWAESEILLAEWPDEKCESETWWRLNESSCKIILKPISDIPDNADLCVEIKSFFGIEEMFTNFMLDRMRYGYNALNTKDVLFIEMPTPLIDKFRRMGYDCGYGDIPSLIEAGIAVSNSDPNVTGAIATEIE